jgi:sugar phosphate isomerase/epimerase
MRGHRAAAVNGSMSLQLGISSYAFGWAVGVPGHPPPSPFTERDLLAFARTSGLGVVQFGDHLPLHTFAPERIASLHHAAREAGITIELGARGLTPGHLHEYLDLARNLQAPLVRFVIDAPAYEPAVDHVISLLRAAVPRLEAENVILGIENHDRFPARTLRRIMEAVGSRHVGICLDTANSLGAGEGIGHVLDELAAHAVNLHVKDFAITRVPHAMGFAITGRPAGQGMLDVPALRDTIAAHGRCRTAILETWTPPETDLAATLAKELSWAVESLAYLKPLFGGPGSSTGGSSATSTR